MPITYASGSIFDSDAQTLVNPVNSVGVMGAGLAKEFRSRYPEMFLRYRERCEDGSMGAGKLLLWKGEDKWVLSFATKGLYANPSRIEYVESGLIRFVHNYSRLGIISVAFPKLGCGLGGLLYKDVKDVMERRLSAVNIPVTIYV